MNTLTDLLPDAFRALDRIGRELTGFIPSVTWDSSLARGIVGQLVQIPVTPPGTAQDIVAATNPPDNGDVTTSNETFALQKARMVPFRWEGEESRGISANGGIGVLTIQQAQIAQAMRTLVNEIESDFAALYTRGSRAVGISGTTPFGTGILLADLANARKILVDNGAGESDLQAVIDTTAGVNVRTIPNLFKVNESGDQGLLRQGVLSDLYGIPLRESAQVKLHTKGTGAGYLVNGALAVGATSVVVDTGAGTILAGDVITFAGDTNQYQVKTALAGGTLVIGKPGLINAVADNVAITVTNGYRANMVFHKSAILGAMRLPALPPGGKDSAADRATISDPRTGLVFEIAMYPQYRRMRYEIGAVWGVKNIKDENVMVIKG